MAHLQGYEIDPLGVLSHEAVQREVERRSRLAYRAWVEACARTGVNVSKPWEELLGDEQGQWADVYGVCTRAETDHEAGVDPIEK